MARNSPKSKDNSPKSKCKSVKGPNKIFQLKNCNQIIDNIWQVFKKRTPRGWIHKSQIAAASPKKGGRPSFCRYTSHEYGSKKGTPRTDDKYLNISFDENPNTAQWVRYSLYAHQLLVIKARQEKYGVNSDKWKWPEKHPVTGKPMVISHDCHRKWCLWERHLRLTDQGDNTHRVLNCIYYSQCTECRSRHYLCECEPRCRAIKYVICSTCAKGAQQRYTPKRKSSKLDDTDSSMPKKKSKKVKKTLFK